MIDNIKSEILCLRDDVGVEFQRWYDKALLCISGRFPRLSLIQHSLYVGVVENLLPHYSQVSSMERWSQNTLRMVTAGVFYVLFKDTLYF